MFAFKRERENSKTIFCNDCSSGLIKNQRHRGGGGGGVGREMEGEREARVGWEMGKEREEGGASERERGK